MKPKINISTYRDCRNRADKEQPCPVKLRLYFSGSTKFLPLVKSNGETPWMSAKDYKATQSKRVPERLKNARRFFDSEILRARRIIDSMPVWNFEQFRLQFTGQVPGSLSADMEKAASRKKTSTKLVYAAALQKLADFIGKSEVQYNDLTPVVVEDFVHSMEDTGMAPDTIKTYLGAIRATVKAAKKKQLVPGDYDPFRAYVAPKGKKLQLQLSVNQFQAVANYATSDPAKQLARDTFVFCTLCMGQYTATVYRLKRTQIIGDWLPFVRQKTKDRTGETLEAYITPTMWEIIERYQDTSGEYIFPVLTRRKEEDHFNAVSSARHRTNKYLKTIATEINAANPMIKLPPFTVKYCRGTYFRLAQEVGGLSFEQASRAGGHTSTRMSEHYDRGFSRAEVEAAAKRIG